MFKRILLLLILFAVVAWLALAFGLRSYQVFTGEEMIAVVESLPAPPGSGFDFRLRVIPMAAGKEGNPQTYGMRGEQWVAGGEYLKWHPWFNLLGVKNCQKLTRLSGRYVRAAAEEQKARTVYDLNGGTSPAWLLLHRIQSILPCVEAVYGNAAYTMADPGGTWGIYVTNSGYLIRRIRSIQR